MESDSNASQCVQLCAIRLIVCITCVVLLLIYIFVDFLIIAILETLLICCDTIFVDID